MDYAAIWVPALFWTALLAVVWLAIRKNGRDTDAKIQALWTARNEAENGKTQPAQTVTARGLNGREIEVNEAANTEAANTWQFKTPHESSLIDVIAKALEPVDVPEVCPKCKGAGKIHKMQPSTLTAALRKALIVEKRK